MIHLSCGQSSFSGRRPIGAPSNICSTGQQICNHLHINNRLLHCHGRADNQPCCRCCTCKTLQCDRSPTSCETASDLHGCRRRLYFIVLYFIVLCSCVTQLWMTHIGCLKEFSSVLLKQDVQLDLVHESMFRDHDMFRRFVEMFSHQTSVSAPLNMGPIIHVVMILVFFNPLHVIPSRT